MAPATIAFNRVERQRVALFLGGWSRGVGRRLFLGHGPCGDRHNHDHRRGDYVPGSKR